MKWSTKHTLGAGAALILAVNLGALTGVAYNRSGQPDSTLRLTEREFRRPYQDWSFGRENSGLAMKLQWRVRTERVGTADYSSFDHYGEPVWLNAQKLAELGVDVSEPLVSERAKRRYGKLPAQEVLLVLELDGENYRAALDEARAHAARAAAERAGSQDRGVLSRAESAAKRLELEEKSNSRLFVIDAGNDAVSLRAKYPERTRYAIVHGRIQPMLSGEGKQMRLRGYIQALSIDQINVPVELRPVFEGLPTDYGYGEPTRRFEAVVTHGRRLEPWLVSARKL